MQGVASALIQVLNNSVRMLHLEILEMLFEGNLIRILLKQ